MLFFYLVVMVLIDFLLCRYLRILRVSMVFLVLMGFVTSSYALDCVDCSAGFDG